MRDGTAPMEVGIQTSPHGIEDAALRSMGIEHLSMREVLRGQRCVSPQPSSRTYAVMIGIRMWIQFRPAPLQTLLWPVFRTDTDSQSRSTCV